MNVCLRAATSTDLEAVLAWLNGAAACQRWAGPAVTFPVTSTVALWSELGASTENAFVLTASADLSVLGFGQLLYRRTAEDSLAVTAHLARLIIAPAQRGHGLGRELCRALLERGRALGVQTFTLRVYPDNAAAVALYRSLGFAVVAEESAEASGSVLMSAHLA